MIDFRAINQGTQLILIIIVFASLKLTLYNSINLGGGDEGYYLNAAKIMRESGDYLTPKYYWGLERVNKPIGLYWLVLVSQAIFGPSIWAARLVSLFSAIGVIIISFVLTKRLFPKLEHPVIVPLVLISSLQFNKFVLDIVPEMTLVFFMGLSHLMIWEIANRSVNKKARRKPIILLYIFLGIGFMIKGPAAVVLPLGTYILYSLSTKRLSLIWDLVNPSGILLFLAIVVPWYAYLYQSNQEVFIELFQREILERVNHVVNLNRKLNFWKYFLPWILLLPLISYQFKPIINEKYLRNSWVFLLSWISFSLFIILFVISEFHGHYLLDIDIPVAIAIGFLIICNGKIRIIKWFSLIILSYLIARSFMVITFFTLLGDIIQGHQWGIIYTVLTVILLAALGIYIDSKKLQSSSFYALIIAIAVVFGQLNYHHSDDKFNWKYPLGGLYDIISKTQNHSILTSHSSINNAFTLTWSIVGDNVGGYLANSQEELVLLLNGANENLVVKQALISSKTYELLPDTVKSTWHPIAKKYYLLPDFNQDQEINYSNEPSFTKKMELIIEFISTRDYDLLFFKYYLIEKY